MKRILLAVDATKPDSQAIDFACYIGRLTKSVITGMFLENFVADEKPVIRETPGLPHVEWDADKEGTAFWNKKALIEKNVENFSDCCERKSVRSSFRLAGGIPEKELVTESRYADLIIVDASTSFNRLYDGRPTEFVRSILQHAECPVIIAPGSFEGIDEIVFAYDGSKSSAFAIKQFAILLPELHDKKATVLHVRKNGEWSNEEKQHFLDWIQNHYSNIGFRVIEGNTDDGLFDYLFKRKNSFIVMGAYGRSNISRFFRHSEADLLINVMTQPIFIAHY
ncbi:universal stress protein [Terrimonas sp. NA20]|uniref:Universal stress protein n=1 Tax=Terrimonas ginsenosidimutans TaxID=2908004 RepID=A0ABS9KVC9_9BACT|nr:universal stress protein [Terrimonas ginsenosidimutans]MCG2616276.1 universal stress protein [Terrimonas ginsenosidimutans]